MEAWAKSQGRPADSVRSIYQGTPEQIREHETHHGYEKQWGPNGVTYVPRDRYRRLKSVPWGKQIFSYEGTEASELARPNVDIAAVKA